MEPVFIKIKTTSNRYMYPSWSGYGDWENCQQAYIRISNIVEIADTFIIISCDGMFIQYELNESFEDVVNRIEEKCKNKK